MQTFSTWPDARTFAVERANTWNTPQGIEKRKEFGRTIYVVRSIPRADKRFGVDLRCEAVEPGQSL